MFKDRIYNFSAGPSMLPVEALERAASDMLNYNGSGMSVMEMSHRSKVYDDLFQDVKAKLREIMSIPQNYHILFMHGGATGQFAAVPMNLMGEGGIADYAITGVFSKGAADEAKKYGKVNISYDTADKNHSYIPAQKDLKLSVDASYFHYCGNNTIYGTEWKYVPNAGGKPIICDMSSNILSAPVDVSKFSMIYAGAQKNMGPAGFAVVIMRDDIPLKALPCTPKILDYDQMVKNDSMPNTPSSYSIYVMGLVLDWLKKLGGLEVMGEINRNKAAILYDFIYNSSFYKAHAQPEARSIMNVTFRCPNDELDAKFAKEASAAGLSNLKGHRSVGGIRASIYNAMPVEGVKKLVEFMSTFERNNK